ncbi:hypothetical protein ERO13_A09G056066v2 [Gossypium hirsutum]|nr:hypothetical protein ERO13_A09G056066v2 [Gossypium hirsutum]
MGKTRQGKPAREHLYNILQDLRGNSLRRPINVVHLRRDGSIEPVVDLAAPLSKKEMQEESEKRQKRKGPSLPRKRPTTPSISQAKESLNLWSCR